MIVIILIPDLLIPHPLTSDTHRVDIQQRVLRTQTHLRARVTLGMATIGLNTRLIMDMAIMDLDTQAIMDIGITDPGINGLFLFPVPDAAIDGVFISIKSGHVDMKLF